MKNTNKWVYTIYSDRLPPFKVGEIVLYQGRKCQILDLSNCRMELQDEHGDIISLLDDKILGVKKVENMFDI